MPRLWPLLMLAATALGASPGCGRGDRCSLPEIHEHRAEGRIWDAETLSARPLFDLGPIDHDPGFNGTLPSVAFSPDGKHVATGGGLRTACVWSVASGKPVFEFGTGKGIGPVQAVQFRTNRELVAADGRAVWLIDVTDRKVSDLFAHGCRLVSLSRGGSLAAGDEYDHGRDLALYAVDGGTRVRTLPTAWNRGLSFSPDGSKLVSISYSHDGPYTVYVWDAKSGRQLGSRHCRNPLAWSPDGGTLAVQSEKADMIELWAWESGGVVEFAHGHDYLNALEFSPNGQMLVSAGSSPGWMSSQLTLWNVATHKKAKTVEAGAVQINAVACSPDGRVIVTTGVRVSSRPRPSEGR